MQEFIDEIIERTKQPIIKLTLHKKTCSVLNSKIGGIPYWPLSEIPPTDKEGNSLKFLAQVNFEEMPELPSFPSKGMLQFFIDHEDYYCGMESFKVLYHPEVEIEEHTDFSITIMEYEDSPIKGEFLLVAELAEMSMTTGDYRFESLVDDVSEGSMDSDEYWGFEEEYLKVFTTKENRFEEIYTCSKLGGYPYFTQFDPRESKKDIYDTLLFQLDSSGYIDENGKDSDNYEAVCWGDAGVGNFFIDEKDLENLNFEKVLYNWDCH
jgi:uncharacterized protein YwqG